MSGKKVKEQRKEQRKARYIINDLTIKNSELRALFASTGLNNLMGMMDIDPTLKLRLLMVTKKLSDVSQQVEKVRQEIVEEHSVKDDNGNPVKDADNLVQFGKSRKLAMGKLDELLDDEVEIKEGKLVIKAKDFEVPLKRLSTMDLLDLSVMLEVLDD
jgi:hypothetical protein